jgi:hypothetical protein
VKEEFALAGVVVPREQKPGEDDIMNLGGPVRFIPRRVAQIFCAKHQRIFVTSTQAISKEHLCHLMQ